jgi:RimJ/RimL family protein N-acetyltransferase
MAPVSAPEETSTDRLHLTRLVGKHAPALYPVMSDEAATVLRERMGWTPITDEAIVVAYATDYERRWEAGDCAAYLVRERDSDTPAGAGFVYLDHADRIEADHAEIGLWLHPDYWDRGLGAELADALYRIAVDHLDCAAVDAATDPGNDRAARMLREWAQRHGGGEVGLVSGPGEGTERRFSTEAATDS